jgi:hypothetical protein
MIKITRRHGDDEFVTRIGALCPHGILISQTAMSGAEAHANRVHLTYAELLAVMESYIEQAEEEEADLGPGPYSGT